jgi:hypothetical protein
MGRKMERAIQKIVVEITFDGNTLWADFTCHECGQLRLSIDSKTFPEITPQLFISRIFAIHGKHFFPDYPMSTSQIQQPRRIS